MSRDTGVFFHEVMRLDDAPMDMDIGKGFDAIERAGLLHEKGIRFFEAEPVAEDLVYAVHSSEWLAEVRRDGYWEVSLRSAGAVSMAFDRILAGELRNALKGVARIEGIDPEDLWALSADFPYVIDISWAQANPKGSYDVLFKRCTTEQDTQLPSFPESLAPP